MNCLTEEPIKEVKEENIIDQMYSEVLLLTNVRDTLDKEINELYSEIGFENGNIKLNINTKTILFEVCKYYRIPELMLIQRFRGEDLPKKRYVAMRLMKDLTAESLASIGHAFGFNHATIHSGLIKFDQLSWQKGVEWMLNDYNNIRTILTIKYIN